MFPFFVFAKEYEIKDIHLKFEINDELNVITRDNVENNEFLKSISVVDSFIKAYLEDKSLYADLLPDDLSYDIMVYIEGENLPVKDLSATSEAIINKYIESNIKSNSDIYNVNVYKAKHTYIYYELHDKKEGYNLMVYHTIANGRGYNFIIQKKDDKNITEHEKDNLKKIVDSASIEKEYYESKESNNIYNKTTNENNSTEHIDYSKIYICIIVVETIALIIIGIMYVINKKKKI